MGEIDITKEDFAQKLGSELWKFAGKCRPKVKKLQFKVSRHRFCVLIKADSGWHKISVSKRRILFTVGRFRYFPDTRCLYYKWYYADDHPDVIAHFATDMTKYYKALCPGKKLDSRCFNYSFQSYDMQVYTEKLIEQEDDCVVEGK